MHARRRSVAPLGIAALSAMLAGCIVITAPAPVGAGSSPDGPVEAGASPEAHGLDAPSSTATESGTPPASAASPSLPDEVRDIECASEGAPTVSGTDQTFRVTGTCAELTVVGDGLVVDASSATTKTLRISGDRITARFLAADAVIVEGDDVSLTAATGIGRLEIDGDRTTAEATTGIPSVTVRGRDNTVRSGAGVGSAVVAGSGNSIR